MGVQKLFDQLWSDFNCRLCPSSHTIHELLKQDKALINDHIALRTFNCSPIGLEVLAKPFIELGYKEGGDYLFKAKKLVAKHYQHPDPNMPKVFISQLQLEQCSSELQAIVKKLSEQIDPSKLQDSAFLHGGRLWDLSFEDYQSLAKESEYASWVAAHGFGANHFTVSVNQLAQFEEVSEVNTFLKDNQFAINASGGEVKGSPEVLLEQSSTMADKVKVVFSDGVQSVPGGFYEFAKRYEMSAGNLYQGFVEASADKIFESTNH
ncbi:DUF1338 domain-containing protein [Vibrio breoganii]|uniref:2-oxoadipate dioxygenase/decarboxylase n=1 Tax=Vibrio breoganii TaxID=553239 RepID=A0ABX1UDN1_9VIBR|nr:DUF1338 domain-containing protein [Vibrio breoganii]NMO74719.1 DUF1338 domain-containing protein [Vibrio breoganii]NMR71212.1 DUF1338 domain-containing protein [Vibrio breoganii]PML85528.1 succinyldiaminopimelate aminotransferase [Vibrio breoganii]